MARAIDGVQMRLGSTFAGLGYAAALLLFMTLGYLDYHRRIELARRVRAAELTRARDEQQLVESRLAAARAELDPERLLDEIDELQRLFVADPVRADAQLDDLIGRLREKLAPTSRHAASAV